MKKIMAVLCVLLIAAGCEKAPQLPEEAVGYSVGGEKTEALIQNDSFILEVSREGHLKVTNKDTMDVFTSVPENAAEDEIAQGVNKNKLMSEFLVTLIKSDGSQAEMNSFEEALNKDGVFVEQSGEEIKVWYDYKDKHVAHSVKYSLEEDGFTLSIDYADFKEQYGKIQGDDWGFMSIGVLPYFGAAGAESDGYIVVPDGCGALIKHNNQKSAYASYAQEIYSRDPSLNLEAVTTEEKTAPFPVYASVEKDKAFEAIIQHCDAEATVYADTSGVTQYNNVYAGFKIRRTDSVSKEITNGYGGNSSLGRTAVWEYRPEDAQIKIKYILVGAADASYVRLARIYGEYLEKNGVEKRADGAPLYIGMTAGISGEAYTLGIPHKTVIPVTDYNESAEIIRDIKANTNEEIVVRYMGWQKGALNSAVPDSFKAEKKLGGEKAFEELKNCGAQIFPEVDFVNFYKSANGLNLQSDCIFALSGGPAYVYEYSVNTGEKDTEEKPHRMLNPLKAKAAREKLGEAEYISLGTMGSKLPSEFNAKNPLSRGESAEVYAKIASEGENVMTEGANSYMLGGVSHIYALSCEATGYDLEDADIPFYQIALHGLRSYSVAPINLTSDTNRAMLKALETGSSLCYSVSGGDVSEISTATPYSYLKELIAEQSRRAMPVIRAVAGEKITDHKKLAENVYCTVFESGATVYVNYSQKPYKDENVYIEAEDFAFKEGKA